MTAPDTAGAQSTDGSRGSDGETRVPLGGDQVGRLAAALEDAFTLNQLRQLMVMGLEDNLSLTLDAVVPVAGRNLHDICHDLVLWSLADDRVGLHGLLDAALRTNATIPCCWSCKRRGRASSSQGRPAPTPGMKPLTAAERGRFYRHAVESSRRWSGCGRDPFLAVIGSSGSGKSSLLAAGILPALEKSHYFADKQWVVRTMRPGAAPYTTLAALLNLRQRTLDAPLPAVAAGTRLLLVVDQFEELFTTAAADERVRFEKALLRLVSTPDCCLIIAARADFYANLMASPLWEQIPRPPLRGNHAAPPHGDALRDAIALPHDVGVQLEPQLVERLLADAGDEPGVLPYHPGDAGDVVGACRPLPHRPRRLCGSRGGQERQVRLAGGAGRAHGTCLSQRAGGRQRTGRRRSAFCCASSSLAKAAPICGGGKQWTALREGSSRGSGEDATFDKVLAALTANRLLTLSDDAAGGPLARGVDPRLATAARVDRRHQRSRADAAAAGAKGRRTPALTARKTTLPACWTWWSWPKPKPESTARTRSSSVSATIWRRSSPTAVRRSIGSPREQQEAARRRGAGARPWRLKRKNRRAAEAQRAARARRAEQAETRRAEEAAQSVRRLRKRNQVLAIALAAALVAVAVAVWFFFNADRARRLEAETTQQEAQRQARKAQAGELAIYAQNAAVEYPSDPSLRLLLAIQSVAITRDADGYFTPNADHAPLHGRPLRLPRHTA